jgi:hypothetical protein
MSKMKAPRQFEKSQTALVGGGMEIGTNNLS